MTDFTPCERTIRLCIEALPGHTQWDGQKHINVGKHAPTISALKALLPDPAKALVEEYRSIFGMQVNDIDKSDIEKITDFTNWLIDTGRIHSEGE